MEGDQRGGNEFADGYVLAHWFKFSLFFWDDNWTMKRSLRSIIEIPPEWAHTSIFKLNKFIENGNWVIPDGLRRLLHANGVSMADITIPLEEEEDELIWEGCNSGILTVKEAYMFYRKKGTTIHWRKNIWRSYIPPKISVFIWKLLNNKLPTEYNALLRGVEIEGGCPLCRNELELEDQNHLLLRCNFSAEVWSWISSLLQIDIRFYAVKELICWCTRRPLNRQVDQVSQKVIFCSLFELWKERNSAVFENNVPKTEAVISRVKRTVAELGFPFHGKNNGSWLEISLLRCLRVTPTNRCVVECKEVRWIKPPAGWRKCNTHGAAHGSPGHASIGGAFRNWRGFLSGAFASPTGTDTALFAEILAFITATEIVVRLEWFPLWFECDSEVLVQMVSKRTLEVPWQLRSRWKNCLQMLNGKQFIVTHTYREGNKVADCLDNLGFKYDDLTWWFDLPDCAREAYDRNLTGLPEFRFCKKG